MLALSDIRTQIRTIIMEVTAAFWTDAEVDQVINDACRLVGEILNYEYLPRLRVEQYFVADGTSEDYELPADYLQIVGVKDNANHRFKYLNVSKYQSGEDSVSYNRENVYMIWNNAIYLRTSGGVVVVNLVQVHLFYVKFPDLLVNDADETELTANLIPLVVDYAVGMLLRKEHEQEANAHLKSFWDKAKILNDRYERK